MTQMPPDATGTPAVRAAFQSHGQVGCEFAHEPVPVDGAPLRPRWVPRWAYTTWCKAHEHQVYVSMLAKRGEGQTTWHVLREQDFTGVPPVTTEREYLDLPSNSDRCAACGHNRLGHRPACWGAGGLGGCTCDHFTPGPHAREATPEDRVADALRLIGEGLRALGRDGASVGVVLGRLEAMHARRAEVLGAVPPEPGVPGYVLVPLDQETWNWLWFGANRGAGGGDMPNGLAVRRQAENVLHRLAHGHEVRPANVPTQRKSPPGA